VSKHTYSNETDRKNGRRQGQGWYLENKARDWLFDQGYRASTRTQIWNREVDVVAVEDEAFIHRREEPPGVHTPYEEPPKRLVVSCVDWFTKESITPCRLDRLIVLALTTRAHPVLVRNYRCELTDPAQKIAEAWRVRIATNKEVEASATLPAPEYPENNYGTTANPDWPSPLGDQLGWRQMGKPDYEL
jgi:hypothetical protein